METIISIKPLLAVLVSLFVIPVLVSSSSKPNVRESWIFVAGTIKLVLVLSMLPVMLEGKQIVLTLFEIAPGDGQPGDMFRVHPSPLGWMGLVCCLPLLPQVFIL